MPMPFWADIYKIFTYAFEDDPLSKYIRSQQLTGVGVTQPDAIPDIRQDGSYWGGGKGLIRLRDSNDFIDLSSVTNRQSRYKEYERLRNMPEIENVMTVIADEACVAGETIVATPFYGNKPIGWFAENVKDPFLTYCWDFEQNDYTLGWASNPRLVKKAATIKIIFDDGSHVICTPDHRILMHSGHWLMTGQLKFGDEVMPFYRLKTNSELNKSKVKQFPRIFSFKEGWKHERQFVDEWRLGRKLEQYETFNKIARFAAAGLNARQLIKTVNHQWVTIESKIRKEGFSYKELSWLGKKQDRRRVVGIQPWKEIDVYDVSVEKHACFATNSVILHNCQKGENNHLFEIQLDNDDAKEELEFLFYHREMLNLDRKLWDTVKQLCIYGDKFWELVLNPENPKDGLLGVQDLAADSMYRIETTRGRLVEFQQSPEGPDYQSLTRNEVTKASKAELDQSTALRFSPNQIVHFRLGDDRKTYYPYGQSLIEPARGPAHQLRLMEDSMVVYRLVRAPERKVFYIDVAQMPPFKAEAFVERIKDQYRKKKATALRSTTPGASAVEERWHPPSADEDFWIPIRPNSQTRVDTLPGAQNLGEIDDALYFRNKLYTALNFPNDYFSNSDPNATRITLSNRDVKFAKMIERIQQCVEDGLWSIADRHLKLRGFPKEAYQDLIIKMTPPSAWKELSWAEVITNRISNASTLKGSQLLSDFDILTKWMKYSEDEAQKMIARNKLQQLEQLRLQIISQNPQLAGVGVPGSGENEMGSEGGGPNPMLAPPGQDDAMNNPPPPPTGGEGMEQPNPQQQSPQPPKQKGPPLPTPSKEELKDFDLEIQNYSSEQDVEDIDHSETD